MPPRKAAAPDPENRFEQAFAEYQAVSALQPLGNEGVLGAINNLEINGLGLIGAGELKTARFAEAMHEVFAKVCDLEVVPPLSDDQKSLIAGKVATYGAMREATAPKTNTPTKPTDTQAIPTDKPKQ